MEKGGVKIHTPGHGSWATGLLLMQQPLLT